MRFRCSRGWLNRFKSTLESFKRREEKSREKERREVLWCLKEEIWAWNTQWGYKRDTDPRSLSTLTYFGMSLSSLSFTWIWASLIVSRVQQYLGNMTGRQACSDLYIVHEDWSSEIMTSLGLIGISNCSNCIKQQPEFISHRILSLFDRVQITGSLLSWFRSQIERESALGDFLFSGKSGSQWEEQHHKKRSAWVWSSFTQFPGWSFTCRRCVSSPCWASAVSWSQVRTYLTHISHRLEL